MRRIAVVGASGLVGATLVERLLAKGTDDVVPFIHGSGNAMRLARRGIKLAMLDLLDAPAMDASLAGITHVVNCSRGDNDVMLTGLKNLLAASRKHGVERFVHLSSVAVYGDPPPPESVREDARTAPMRGTYGWVKLQQDDMVLQAASGGLPCVTLCPPNISGPYSYFLVSLVGALRADAFALLEDGTAPCSLVDVSNLCHAIELALAAGTADGRRIFVTDDADTDWRSVVESLLPLIPSRRPVPRIGRDALQRAAGPTGAPTISLARSLKHLVSSEVRQAMRRDPLWERVDIALRRTVMRMGSAVENRLRSSVEGPIKVARVAPGQRLDAGLCRQQLRGVRHSCAQAKARLGYEPQYTTERSMEAFRKWYRASRGMDTDVWPLLQQIQ